MRIATIIAGLAGSLAIIGFAGEASAQSNSGASARSRIPTVTLSEANNAQASTVPSQRRGLRWNSNGRWGLNFNLNQPVGRERDWGDVEAGAYYSLSPRLRVGAAAGLGASEPDPARAPETERTAPRIRLESLFKF